MTPNYDNDGKLYKKYTQEFTNYPRSILSFKTERGLHPTQKPVALFEYLIKTYTNPGELILDNCSGSGTAGIAAHNTGRNYVLIEQEQEYINIINNRLDQSIIALNQYSGSAA